MILLAAVGDLRVKMEVWGLFFLSDYIPPGWFQVYNCFQGGLWYL
jgi:hypothetical protein